MTTDQLIQRFIDNHNNSAAFICSLPDEHFTYRHDTKWSAGQQLAHLVLCLKPISQALSSAAFIKEKFGTIDRAAMDYDEVIAFYNIGLQNGGKAPEKFLPSPVEVHQREALQQELTEILSTIESQLNSYSDVELDSLALPHPFLGLLSIRELFYLMSYHPLHHLEQVRKNIDSNN
jgi:hypothetical protein